MDEILIQKIEKLALELWREQYELMGGYPPNPDEVWEWMENHTFGLLKDAANGNVEALAALRQECGLPILC